MGALCPASLRFARLLREVEDGRESKEQNVQAVKAAWPDQSQVATRQLRVTGFVMRLASPHSSAHQTQR